MNTHPKWIRKRKKVSKKQFSRMKEILESEELHTVCQEAQCPNLRDCWGTGSATFMVLGDACTRSCQFCAVKNHPLTPPDTSEPVRLANAIEKLGIKYVVLTSVTRDDLPDQGADHYAKCIKKIKQRTPDVIVEALIPDFQGHRSLLKKVVNADPEVIGHNVETVKRLQDQVRDPRANYEQSLTVLNAVKELDEDIYTKSSLMLGLGERKNEVLETMEDLREIEVDILTLGQYLQPSDKQMEVERYIEPEEFQYFKEKGEEKGFLYVAAGPFVRSSYKSAEFFTRKVLEQTK